MKWTPPMDATLQRMWKDGCSAGIIGQALGVSRHSVRERGTKQLGLRKDGATPAVSLTTHPHYTPRHKRQMHRIPEEGDVWELDEDERRAEFVRRAANGARMTLGAAAQ